MLQLAGYRVVSMKIVHVIETLDPSYGGPSVSAPSTAAAQAAHGHEVSIVFYYVGDTAETFRSLKENIPGIDQVNLIAIARETRQETIFASAAKAQLKTLIATADIVHLQGVWRPILLNAAKIAQTLNKRYVISPRGMLDPWSLQQKAWKKKLGLYLGWKKAIDKAHFIHALNKAEAELLAPLNIKAPVKVFPNGTFPEKFINTPDKSAFLQKFPAVQADRPYVLFLSRLHYKKGLDFLMDAFIELAEADSETQLVVAGPDDGLQAEVEALVKRHKLESRVHIVGPLYGDIKYSALAGAACFCLPSRQEGFSMAITEALACGTPAVVSDQCHFDEVESADVGRVVPLSVVPLVHGLRDIIQRSSTDRPGISERARRLVFDNFSWHVIAEQLSTAYDSKG